MNPCWNTPGGQISILRDKSLLAFLITTISNKIMVKGKKLIPTPKVEVEETKEVEIGIEPKKEEKKIVSKGDTKIYSVFNKFNQFVREYTPEIHGDKRKELAEEFANKIKGKVVIK